MAAVPLASATGMKHLTHISPITKTTCHSCALMSGIDPAIVSRADELVLLSARGEDLVSACAGISTQEEEDLAYAVCSFHNLLSIRHSLSQKLIGFRRKWQWLS